jgi:prevent-host-death family protein
MQVNMLEAKTKLSQLVDAVEHGEEVLLARNGVPVARLVPVRKQKLPFGFLKGKIPPVADGLLFAMTEEEADHFIGIEKLI